MAIARRQRMGGLLDERRRTMLDTSPPKPWEPPTCPDCGGTGTITTWHYYAEFDFNEERTASCKSCLGSGLLTDEATRRYLVWMREHPTNDPF